MFNPSSQLNWFALCLLVGIAAAICQISSRKLLYLVFALLLAPLPAFLFMQLMTPAPTDVGGAWESQPFGALFAVLTCYLPPALGVATAYFHQRPPLSRVIDGPARSGRESGRRQGHTGRPPSLSKQKRPTQERW